MKKKPTKRTRSCKKKSKSQNNLRQDDNHGFFQNVLRNYWLQSKPKDWLIDKINKAERWARSADKALEVEDQVKQIHREITKWQSSKGGSAPKKKRGILLAIKGVLSKNPQMTALQLWNYFKKNHPDVNHPWCHKTSKGDLLEVYFEEDIKGEKDMLVEVWNEKDRLGNAIGFKAFEKYVSTIKSTLIST